MRAPLLLRNVEVAGRPGLDVRLVEGRIAEIGERLSGPGEAIDGRGGALIPGLVDHHIHLLALAAQAGSLQLQDVRDAAGFEAALRAAAGTRPPGAWLRATGYHHRMAGEIGRQELDRIAPRHPVRVQHQTGSLWVLNSLALEQVLQDEPPAAVERGADGRPTGRIWRGDAWLRERLPTQPPNFAEVGRRLAACGVTAVTDASASTDAGAAALLADARRTGDLPQRLLLMSAGELSQPADGAFALGPLKVLLDDARLPELDDFVARIAQARAWGRQVAVHCVTAAEFALTLAAFQIGGARPGDRIEHGGVIPAEAIPTLAEMRLTVVTQSGFVFERGDRYRAEVEPREQADLYRCASLLRSGVAVAGSSDAPYASPDPWLGIRAAIARRTRDGADLGVSERVDPTTALGLYQSAPERPSGPPRRVVAGVAADLCLLAAPLAEVLGEPSADRVAATLIGGRVVHSV